MWHKRQDPTSYRIVVGLKNEEKNPHISYIIWEAIDLKIPLPIVICKHGLVLVSSLMSLQNDRKNMLCC